jgi:hypothetical protein
VETPEDSGPRISTMRPRQAAHTDDAVALVEASRDDLNLGRCRGAKALDRPASKLLFDPGDRGRQALLALSRVPARKRPLAHTRYHRTVVLASVERRREGAARSPNPSCWLRSWPRSPQRTPA